MLSDLELMELHVNVLFKHDTENSLTSVNEPPYYIAPRISVGGTHLGSVVRYSKNLDVSLVKKLEQVIGTNSVNLSWGNSEYAKTVN